YTDGFVLPLPAHHRFPMTKYSRLRERLVDEKIVASADLATPPAADDLELGRAHDSAYLERVKLGTLTAAEQRRIGFPWSLEMVERSRRSSGATLAACRTALTAGVAANLAGGTHHAFFDCGEGYCVFNDSVVAARALQGEGRVRRVLVVDCDVHQGNGTAAIVRDDPTVFTFSIHGANNFPYRKEQSDLDVPLDDGAQDEEYLAALDDGLRTAFDRSRPDLAIYLAGADPLKGDRFGRLALTFDGLAERDRRVFERCSRAGVPVAVTMAGGYAPNVEDTVEVHRRTIEIAARLADEGRV
ncbi:MAG: histone deacetylase family protein, partial [Planctomycetia bacterium]